MRLQGSVKCSGRDRLPRISAALLLVILAACVQTPAPPAPVAPSTPTVTGKTKVVQPLGCTEFDPVTYENGKPGLTVKDVQDALADPVNPLGKARNVLGDTSLTKGQIDVYMRERAALCTK